MAYLQISDVLERMQRFHAALSTYFDSARDAEKGAGDDRRSQVLAALKDQESALARNLEQVKEMADEAVTRTWLQFDLDPELWRQAEEELGKALVKNPEHALELALGIDRKLLSVYERIASAQVPPRVQDLFSELAEMQRSRMRRRALENLDSEI